MSSPWPRSPRRWLIALALLFGCAVLAVVVALLIIARIPRSQLQAAASDALGMQVSILGAARIQLHPTPGVLLQDVRIRSRDTSLMQAQQVRLAIEVLPLLRGQLRIRALGLTHVTLSIEELSDGSFNFERAAPGAASLPATPALPPIELTLSDATVLYGNAREGSLWQAGPCNVKGRLQLLGTSSAVTRSLVMTAAASCTAVQLDKLPLENLNVSISASQGVFEFKPIAVRICGGEGAGELRADYNGSLPVYRAHFVLSKFRLEQLRSLYSQKKIGEGSLDFSADLSMSGRTVSQLTRSSEGEATLRGENLTLLVGDLDSELSRYETAQNFNLVDVGAFLLAGPIGLAVTKGYDFARVLDATGGSSVIPLLISNWHIEQGVAQATDVAMTTRANRLALKGALDFVNDRFQSATVALVDKQGCARVEQGIHGALSKPEADKPNVVSSLTGPARSLVNAAKHMVGEKCQVFYDGSVAAPQ
jgi:AsmA protein